MAAQLIKIPCVIASSEIQLLIYFSSPSKFTSKDGRFEGKHELRDRLTTSEWLSPWYTLSLHYIHHAGGFWTSCHCLQMNINIGSLTKRQETCSTFTPDYYDLINPHYSRTYFLSAFFPGLTLGVAKINASCGLFVWLTYFFYMMSVRVEE